jgi:predicted GIY-YIG superfamily endonuclease
LAYARRLKTLGDALRFELALKRCSHAEKRDLAHRWKTRKKYR